MHYFIKGSANLLWHDRYFSYRLTGQKPIYILIKFQQIIWMSIYNTFVAAHERHKPFSENESSP